MPLLFFFLNMYCHPCPSGIYEEIRYIEVVRSVGMYYKLCIVIYAMPGKKLYIFLKLHLALEIPLWSQHRKS